MNFPPVYGTLNENQLVLRSHQREGGTDIPFTVAVYPFLAKNTMLLFIFTEFYATFVFLVL